MEEINKSDKSIRDIEDILNLQKANGVYDDKQVVFDQASETTSSASASQAKSLDTGLCKKKKSKKFRSKRSKNKVLSDFPWPSDSVITVLRMKLRLTSCDVTETVGNVQQGDGPHQPDSSSMINLVTLINESQPQSEHSMMKEFLLPLTSWEQHDKDEKKSEDTEPKEVIDAAANSCGKDFTIYRSVCRYNGRNENGISGSKDSGDLLLDTKSKFTRFLRLYFCPCCSCLYKFEMNSDSSAYNSNTQI